MNKRKEKAGEEGKKEEKREGGRLITWCCTALKLRMFIHFFKE